MFENERIKMLEKAKVEKGQTFKMLEIILERAGNGRKGGTTRRRNKV